MGQDIVDNSKEMAFDSPEFQAMLTGSKPDPEPDTKDVKPEPKAVSSTAPADKDDDPLDKEAKTPAELEAQVRGLKAELKRRQGNAEKIAELEQELAYVTGKLEVLATKKATDSQTDELNTALQGLDDSTLSSKEIDWSAELTSALSKYDRAEEIGNTEEMGRQAQRIYNAKRVIKAIRAEVVARTERKVTQNKEQEQEATTLKTELDTMVNVIKELAPEMLVEGSELWKAGKAEYDAHPAMMKRMGPAGELVAAALAVVKNPHLVGAKSAKEVRKSVLDQIDKGFGKALKTGGAAAPSTGRTMDLNVGTREGMEAFNKVVEQIKGGG